MYLVLFIVLLGPPGAGKSTQAARLAVAHGIPVIATGELLRAEVARDSPLGRRVRDTMAAGRLVDDAIVDELVTARLAAPDCARGAIFDGYPRTVEQAETLDRWLQAHRLPGPIVIDLDAPDDVLLARLGARGRADDEREIAARRLARYRAESAPVVAYYRGRAYWRVSAEGAREDVFKGVEAAVAAASGRGR